jgi:Tol biopolymer transport system component
MIRLNLSLASFCVAALSLSCQSPNPAEPSPTPTEDRGIPLTSGVTVGGSELVWSKSGREIYYGTPGSIRAVSVPDKSTRLLDARGWDWPYDLTLSSDGNYLYYLMTSDILRINLTTQTSELVISHVREYSRYIVSPDNNHIAYVSSDSSLCVLDLVTMVNRRMAVGEPRVFSPDGKEILYWQYPTYYILSCESGATRSVSTDLSDQERVGIYSLLLRWDDRGIRIFYTGPTCRDYNVCNLTTGTTLRIWSATGTTLRIWSAAYCHFAPHAWSPDGKTIALWTSECVQYSLHAIDIDAPRERTVASGNLASYPQADGWIAFSPDSRRIAYVLGSDIYMKDIQ